MSKRNIMISVRLSSEEAERLNFVVTRILDRERRYAKRADVLRELLGIVDTGMVLSADRSVLAYGVPAPDPLDAASLRIVGKDKRRAK